MEVSFRYDHPHILSGQGTLGLEIVEEVPDLEAVVILWAVEAYWLVLLWQSRGYAQTCR